jgi:hypothetical protein
LWSNTRIGATGAWPAGQSQPSARPTAYRFRVPVEARRQAILEDQHRLRENVKVLGRSTEERQLLQRYTRQLDQQENRLEMLRRELARATGERDRLRQELAQFISETAFEVAR